MSLEVVSERWKAFGWNVIEIDGHDMREILDALHKADAHKKQPTMIILHTVKGKGVSFMENRVEYHGVAPTDEEYEKAMRELDELEKKIHEKYEKRKE